MMSYIATRHIPLSTGFWVYAPGRPWKNAHDPLVVVWMTPSMEVSVPPSYLDGRVIESVPILSLALCILLSDWRDAHSRNTLLSGNESLYAERACENASPETVLDRTEHRQRRVWGKSEFRSWGIYRKCLVGRETYPSVNELIPLLSHLPSERKIAVPSRLSVP